MSSEILRLPVKLFELEVRGFVVFNFDHHGKTLIELGRFR